MRSPLLVASLLVAGCHSGPTIAGFNPEPAPLNGMQILLPPVENIKSGESYEYCTWTEHILDHDVDIKASETLQSPTGHHAVFFYTTKYQPAGTTRLCTDDDMATFRFSGPSGENQYVEAPADLVFRIPAGAQLVVNHHYLNASPRDMTAQSAINLRFNTPGAAATPAGSLAFLDTTMRIPTGAQGLDINCTVDRDYRIWTFFPHMHRWGTHVTIDQLPKGGGSTRLFDLDWQEDFTFHAPRIDRDPSTPFLLNQGDQIKVHCDWQNDSGHDLTFGLEMCVAFAQTINDRGLPNLACDGGSWTDF